eukprot:2056919-Rhodomonas_salina.1
MRSTEGGGWYCRSDWLEVERMRLSEDGAWWEKEVALPPGKHSFKFLQVQSPLFYPFPGSFYPFPGSFRVVLADFRRGGGRAAPGYALLQDVLGQNWVDLRLVGLILEFSRVVLL